MTSDELKAALLGEVMQHRPASLTSMELLAALAFADDVRVFEPGHPAYRLIRTPLDDPRFQEYIKVNSAQKVKELAKALADKGVLEPVGDTYRIADLPLKEQS
jgi:hypothetical protein